MKIPALLLNIYFVNQFLILLYFVEGFLYWKNFAYLFQFKT